MFTASESQQILKIIKKLPSKNEVFNDYVKLKVCTKLVFPRYMKQ